MSRPQIDKSVLDGPVPCLRDSIPVGGVDPNAAKLELHSTSPEFKSTLEVSNGSTSHQIFHGIAMPDPDRFWTVVLQQFTMEGRNGQLAQLRAHKQSRGDESGRPTVCTFDNTFHSVGFYLPARTFALTLM